MPANFDSFNLAGENVLRVGIDGPNDGSSARNIALGPPFGGSLYNTQGRKLDLTVGSHAIRASLWVPTAWLGAVSRQSSMSGNIVNAGGAVTIKPAIGVANLNDGSPVLRYWDGSAWVNTAVALVGDTWYDLEIVLLGETLTYRVNSTDVGTVALPGSIEIQDAIFQTYNFNDPALPPAQQSDDVPLREAIVMRTSS